MEMRIVPSSLLGSRVHQLRFRFLLASIGVLLSGCIHTPAGRTTSPICAAAPKSEAEDPLYGIAREILSSPDPHWAAFRRQHAIVTTGASAIWVTDDRICGRVVGALGPQAEAAGMTIPVAVIRAGNVYVARVHPLSQGAILDSTFEVLTIFVMPF